MTNPIPGADIDRIEFFDKRTGIAIQPNESDAYFVMIDIVWRDTFQTCESQSAVVGFDDFIERCPNIGWRVDSAAKVGANVAADIETPEFRRLLARVQGWADEKPVIGSLAKDLIDHINAWGRDLAAGAPAETPKPVAVELIGVAEQIEQGAGFWHSCSGCHDTEDGHPTGNYAYSNEMRCALGNGCAECGGLGAVWDNNDYSEAAGDFLFAQPAPIAGDVEKDAAMREAVCEAIAGQLTGLYHCGRVWSAWSVGTMGEDDFSPAEEDIYIISNIADAAIAAMLANSSSGEAG